MKKAPFIVIDGMDGSGKTTQFDLLVKYAKQDGYNFCRTREPGGTELSETIRTLFKSALGMNTSALTQFLMMWTARSDTLDKVVIPSIRNEIPVFDERSDISTFAYQVFAKMAPELEDEFWRIRKLVFGEYEPTMYIILDLPSEEAKRRVDADKRRTALDLSDFDLAPLDFYERVRQGFHAFKDELPNHVIMVDGTRSPEVVHEEIYAMVCELCGWQ